ncbi:MAG: hypothetical protein IK095_03365 [Oscillospiraceae bacterium]|nr:hypothetical protein [Oscillospiraceae bacterium]
MEKREFAVWAAALQTYFPRYEILPNAQAMGLWYQELQDIPAEVLTAALRKWVTTERFPPSIAELRALCADLVQGPPPDWGAAWREVVHAIGRYGDRVEDAYAHMSPLTRRTVESIGYRDICMSENTEIIRAQFRQVYQIVAQREKEDRQIPPALKEMLSAIGSRPNVLPQTDTRRKLT